MFVCVHVYMRVCVCVFVSKHIELNRKTVACALVAAR